MGWMVGWFGALVAWQQLPALWPSIWFVAALIPVALAWWRWGQQVRLGTILQLLLAALLACSWAGWRAEQRLQDALPAEWEGRDVVLEGWITELPEIEAQSSKFQIRVAQVITPQAVVPQRIRLSWYAPRAADRSTKQDAERAAVPVVQVGERWRWTVRLKRPHGALNPAGFDYEGWLFQRGIRATGTIRHGERLPGWQATPGTVVERARAQARSRMQQALGTRRYAPELQALVMGDQQAIPQDHWDLFRVTGITHLVSISGLHVTMIAGLWAALAGWIWRRLPGACLHCPAARVMVLAGAIGGSSYAILAGLSIPTQRTLFMLLVICWALWRGRKQTLPRSLGRAAWLVSVFDPWAVLAPGFWLSFGAVGVMVWATFGRVGTVSAWRQTIAAQWAVTVGLIPALLFWFQQVSLISPLANAIAIPAVGLIVTPLALLGAALPWDGVLHLAHTVLAGCMVIMGWLAQLEWASWEQAMPSPLVAALGALAVALLLLPRGTPWVPLALSCSLPMMQPSGSTPGQVIMTVWDVGQGLAVLVQSGRHSVLYDTGPGQGDQNAGQRVIVPELRALGIQALDGVVLSHDDGDHTGGALSVQASHPAGWLLHTLPPEQALLGAYPQTMTCRAGMHWQMGAARFRVLHPSGPAEGAKDNDRSCVLQLQVGAHRVLFSGDIEKRGEAELVARHGATLASDILIAPHHGSRTSSTPALLAAVQARHILVSAGYRNPYRHPHPTVLARYTAAGAEVHRTDCLGALRLRLDAPTLHIESLRATRRRYWHQTSCAAEPEPKQHSASPGRPGVPGGRMEGNGAVSDPLRADQGAPHNQAAPRTPLASP